MKIVSNLKKFSLALITGVVMSCTVAPAFSTQTDCNMLARSIPDLNKILRNQELPVASKGLRKALERAGIEETTIDLQISILEYVDAVKDRYSIQKQQQEVIRICNRANSRGGV